MAYNNPQIPKACNLRGIPKINIIINLSKNNQFLKMFTSSHSVFYRHKIMPQYADGCNAKQYGNYSGTTNKKRDLGFQN